MLFSPKNKTVDYTVKLHYGDSLLDFVDYYSYLDVHFQSKLSWS